MKIKNQSVVLYGPQVCGQFRDAVKIAALLGLSCIVDSSDFNETSGVNFYDTLYVTSNSAFRGMSDYRDLRILQFSDFANIGGNVPAPPMPGMNVPGYEELARILALAYDDSANGKGKERHAVDGIPWHEQSSARIARDVGAAGPIFQVEKKVTEALRLPRDRALLEIRGAIVYAALAHLTIEKAPQ